MAASASALVSDDTVKAPAGLCRQPEAFNSWFLKVPTADRESISRGAYWSPYAAKLSPDDVIVILDKARTFRATVFVLYCDKRANVRVVILENKDLPSTAEASA